MAGTPCVITSPFLLVLRLLQHEHVAVELLLQHLVREVDAQLLEAVADHDFEPCQSTFTKRTHTYYHKAGGRKKQKHTHIG